MIVIHILQNYQLSVFVAIYLLSLNFSLNFVPFRPNFFAPIGPYLCSIWCKLLLFLAQIFAPFGAKSGQNFIYYSVNAWSEKGKQIRISFSAADAWLRDCPKSTHI